MDVELKHVALHFSEKEKAETFFTKIFNLQKLKEFSLSIELSQKVFGIEKQVEIAVYGNEKTAFEVFFTEKIPVGYAHVCVSVPSIEELRKKCEQFQVRFFTAEKEGRELYFVRDFSGNLYEIKEF